MNPTSPLAGTSFNKAIVAVLVPLIAWANQRWGLALPMDADTLSLLVMGVTALVVYLTPNRVNSDQAAQIVAATKTDPIIQAKAAAIKSAT